MYIEKWRVVKLRQMTGCALMDCKKALMATDGDINKAVEYLKNHQPHVLVYHPPIIDEDVKSDN